MSADRRDQGMDVHRRQVDRGRGCEWMDGVTLVPSGWLS